MINDVNGKKSFIWLVPGSYDDRWCVRCLHVFDANTIFCIKNGAKTVRQTSIFRMTKCRKYYLLKYPSLGFTPTNIWHPNWRHYTKQNDIQHNNKQNVTLSIMTLRIMTLRIMTLSIMTLSIMTVSIMTQDNETLHKDTQHNCRLLCWVSFMLSNINLNVLMQRVI